MRNSNPNRFLMPQEYLKTYKESGYAIIRNFFEEKEIEELKAEIDLVASEGDKHQTSYRHKNLLYVIQKDQKLGKVLRFCQWPSYNNQILEKYRTDHRFFNLLRPLLGDNIKQIINQIIWKTPGSDQTSYGFHQDARFRRPESAYRDLGNSFVQCALAIDPHRENNGCLVFVEKSHLLGNLKYVTNKSVFQENISDDVLQELGVDKLPIIEVILNPGDLAIWHPFLLHGSPHNYSKIDRRTYLNGYVKAENSDRGEWAFKNGIPQKLSEPQLVQFEELHNRPNPFYLE